MLYLDHAASTPIDSSVVETVSHVMMEYIGNPSSAHALGEQAAKLVEAAREQIASSLNVPFEELIFTSGGTESNNLALKGVASIYRNKGKHIVVTAADHPSVLECARQMSIRDGFTVTIVPVDERGFVNPETLESALTPQTILVSMVHANSEIGSVQPIEEVAARLAKFRHILFHIDCSQTIGKLPVILDNGHIDLLTASAHKWHGPKGVGFLYARKGIQLQPLINGGGQQFGIRAGTENVPLIAGMAKAIRLHGTYDEVKTARLYQLRKYWLEQLSSLPHVRLSGSTDSVRMAPHIVHFCLTGFRAEIVVRALSMKKIYVSSQSACSSKSGKPSAFLLSMGKSEREARSGIRLSFDATLLESQIDFFCLQLRETLAQLAH
jgi:cysteine desulfurase